MIGRARVFAIIPARGGSARLPRKNVAAVWGRPMLAWSIDAARTARTVDRVFVSTEDAAIADAARLAGAEVLDRPAALADAHTIKQDVIAQAVETLESRSERPDIVISLQANSPQIRAADLDGAVEKLVRRRLWEVFSVDRDLIQNGAFRVMTRDTVFFRSLSAHCGVWVTDCLDIHTAADLAALERLGPPKAERETD